MRVCFLYCRQEETRTQSKCSTTEPTDSFPRHVSRIILFFIFVYFLRFRQGFFRMSSNINSAQSNQLRTEETKSLNYLQTRLLVTVGNKICCLFAIYGCITNSQRSQLPVGLIAQLVEHCTGITENTGSNPVQA